MAKVFVAAVIIDLIYEIVAFRSIGVLAFIAMIFRQKTYADEISA